MLLFGLKITKKKQCDCCKHKTYSQKCTLDSSTDAQWNASCKAKKDCSLSIRNIDLSEHCKSQIDYKCNTGCCKSRWLNITYYCEQGMKIKLLV